MVHGVGTRPDGRRTLSMGVVKDDDGDLDKALAYHRECMVRECGAARLGMSLSQAMGRRCDALILSVLLGD